MLPGMETISSTLENSVSIIFILIKINTIEHWMLSILEIGTDKLRLQINPRKARFSIVYLSLPMCPLTYQ